MDNVSHETKQVGRPTKYSPDLIKEVEDYITSCKDTTEQVVTGESDKFTSYKEKVIVKLPSIEGLAAFLKISKDTIYQWEKEYPEFSYVINALRAEQADRLINSGLSGTYNAYIAKALLAKHGYYDRQEIKHEGTAIGFLSIDPLDDQTNDSPPQDSEPQKT